MNQDNPLLEKAKAHADSRVKRENTELVWAMIFQAYLAGHAEGASSSVNGGVWVKWIDRKPGKSGDYIFKIEFPNHRANYAGVFWLFGSERPLKAFAEEFIYWLDESAVSRPSLPKEVTEDHFSDTLDSIIKGQLEKARERVKELEQIIENLKKAMITGKELYDNINWDDLEHYEVKTKEARIKELEDAMQRILKLPDESWGWLDQRVRVKDVLKRALAGK